MALAAIVDDIGADRGFLLSEIGFQSGAIHQAAKRNITLTSLQDLRETVAVSAGEQALAAFSWRAALAKKEIRRRHYEGGKYRAGFLISDHWFDLDYLTEVFDEAAREQYPIVYKFNTAENIELIANNLDELISGVEAIVVEAEEYLAQESESGKQH